MADLLTERQWREQRMDELQKAIGAATGNPDLSDSVFAWEGEYNMHQEFVEACDIADRRRQIKPTDRPVVNCVHTLKALEQWMKPAFSLLLRFITFCTPHTERPTGFTYRVPKAQAKSPSSGKNRGKIIVNLQLEITPHHDDL